MSLSSSSSSSSSSVRVPASLAETTWKCVVRGCNGVTRFIDGYRCLLCGAGHPSLGESISTRIKCVDCGAYRSTSERYCIICHEVRLNKIHYTIIDEAGLGSGIGENNEDWDYNRYMDPLEPLHSDMHLTDTLMHHGNIPGVIPIRRVTAIQFRPMLPHEIVANSVVENKIGKYSHMCVSKEHLNINELSHTVADNHMGAPLYNGIDERSIKCETCRATQNDECTGHFGHLSLPVHIISPMMTLIACNLIDLICLSCERFFYCNEELLNCNSKEELDIIVGTSNDYNELLFTRELKSIYIKYISRKAKNSKRAVDRLFKDLVSLMNKTSGNSIVACINCGVNQNIFNLSFLGDPACYWRITINNENYMKMKTYTEGKENSRLSPSAIEIYKCSIGAANNLITGLSGGEINLLPYQILNRFGRSMKQLTSRMTCDIIGIFTDSWPIAPPQVRPTSILQGSNKFVLDPITTQYDQLIIRSNRLRYTIEQYGVAEQVPFHIMKDHQEEIQSAVNGICNNKWRSDRDIKRNKKMISIINRHQGKPGRWRQHILGKRVEYSCRSVASPDPNLDQDEVSCPLELGTGLASDVVCSSFNKPKIIAWFMHLMLVAQYKFAGWKDFSECGSEGINLPYKPQLRQAYQWYKEHCHRDWRLFDFDDILKPGRFVIKYTNSAETPIPGLDFGLMIQQEFNKYDRLMAIKKSKGGIKIIIKNPVEIIHNILINCINELKDGMEVTLPMVSGDIMVIQRYPSLRENAANAYRVRLQKGRRTIGFKLEGASIKGLDFDGDDLNGHKPIRVHVIAEAKLIMAATELIQSRYSGEAGLGLIQDALAFVFMLTAFPKWISPADFMNMVYAMGDDIDLSDADLIPAILKPKPLFTGWQLLKIALAHNHSSVRTFMPLKDPFQFGSVLPRQDEYPFAWYNHYPIGGIMNKDNVGPKATAKYNAIFLYIARYENKEEGLKSMNRVSLCANSYLETYGFSIGLKDLMDTVNADEQSKLQKLKKSKSEALRNIRLREDILEQNANESYLIDEAQKIQEEIQKQCMKVINTERNALYIMVKGGSKGKPSNVANMIGHPGIQMPYGELISTNICNRSITMGRISYCYAPRRLIPKYNTGKFDNPGDIISLTEYGYNDDSLLSGLNPVQFFHMCQTDRPAISSTAVDTPRSGYSSRRMITSVNGVVSTYGSIVMEHQCDRVIQFEYGHDGTTSTRAIQIQYITNENRIKEFASRCETFQLLVSELFEDASIIQNSVDGKFIINCNTSIYMDHELIKINPPISPIIQMAHDDIYRILEKWLIIPLGINLPSFPRKQYGCCPCSAEMLYIICRIVELIIDMDHHLNRMQFIQMLQSIVDTWFKTRVEPGEASGVAAVGPIANTLTQSTLSSKHNSKAGAIAANESVPTILAATGSSYRFPITTELEADEIGKDETLSIVSLSDILSTSNELAHKSGTQLSHLMAHGIGMGDLNFHNKLSKALVASHENSEIGTSIEIRVIPSTNEAANAFANEFLKPITIGMCTEPIRNYVNVIYDALENRIQCESEWLADTKEYNYFDMDGILGDKKKIRNMIMDGATIMSFVIDPDFIDNIYKIDSTEIFCAINGYFHIKALYYENQELFESVMYHDNNAKSNKLIMLVFVSNLQVTESILPTFNKTAYWKQVKTNEKDPRMKNAALLCMPKLMRECMSYYIRSCREASMPKVIEDKIYIRYSSLKGLIHWLNGSYVELDHSDGKFKLSRSKDYSFQSIDGYHDKNRIYFDPYRTCCYDSAVQVADFCGIAAANMTLSNMYYNATGAAEMNVRHAYLLSDFQTVTGNLEPFTRHGDSISNGGPIKAMSFENQLANTILAATDFMNDNVTSLAAATLLGHTIPVGTGYNKTELLLNTDGILNNSISQNHNIEFDISKSNTFQDIDTTGFFNHIGPTEQDHGSVSISSFSPLHESKDEKYSPMSPIYAPSSPVYAPNSPHAMYSPSSPQYYPTSPPASLYQKQPNIIGSPEYVYAPTSPTYCELPQPINPPKTPEYANPPPVQQLSLSSSSSSLSTQDEYAMAYMDPRFDNDFYRSEWEDFLRGGPNSTAQSSSVINNNISQTPLQQFNETKRLPSVPIPSSKTPTGDQLRDMHNQYLSRANEEFPLGFLCEHGPVQPGIPCPGCQFKMANHHNRNK